jgi:hypothetical protein
MPKQIRRGAEGKLDLTPELLSGVDAVVHLAGENVATGDGPLGFLGVQVSFFPNFCSCRSLMNQCLVVVRAAAEMRCESACCSDESAMPARAVGMV